jgi:hypothetical protein
LSCFLPVGKHTWKMALKPLYLNFVDHIWHQSDSSRRLWRCTYRVRWYYFEWVYGTWTCDGYLWLRVRNLIQVCMIVVMTVVLYRSVACYDNAVRLKPGLDQVTQTKHSVLCHRKLEKGLLDLHEWVLTFTSKSTHLL